MQKQSIAIALVVLTLATACTDGDARTSPLEPGFTSQSSILVQQPSIGLGSTLLSTQRVVGVRCPEIPPFVTPFDVTIVAGRASHVVLDSMRLGFTDVTGIPMPQVTFPPPVLTSLVGTNIVPAGGSQTFPFFFRFGCETRSTGTLIVIVNTRDNNGRLTSTQLSATVK
jgi:hypothetical protein